MSIKKKVCDQVSDQVWDQVQGRVYSQVLNRDRYRVFDQMKEDLDVD